MSASQMHASCEYVLENNHYKKKLMSKMYSQSHIAG